MSQPIAQCPCCFARVPMPEGTTSLICPSCEHEFTPDGAPVRPKPRRASRPAESSGDRPRPRFKENDRRERKRYDDESEKKGGSGMPLLLVAGGGLTFLVLVGVAAIVVAFMSNSPVAQNTTSASPTTANGRPKTEPTVVQRGGWNDANPGPFFEPKKPEEPKPEPPKPIPNVPPDAGPNPFNPPWKPKPPKGEGPRPEVPKPVFPKPEPPKPEPPKPAKRPAKYADVMSVVIKPAKLDEDRVEVRLPGKVADVCVGGGGRFLILHLADEKKLAVFDVMAAKVVKLLPLIAREVKFAAGMNMLVGLDMLTPLSLTSQSVQRIAVECKRKSIWDRRDW